MHHRVEAQVIAACIVKASRPELQDFCRRLDGVQTAQADLMRQFLKQWFGPDVPNTPVPIPAPDAGIPALLASNWIGAGTRF